MNEYFEGKKLYGDDFSIEQIKKWYDEETEGYADLGNADKKKYSYGYHTINKIHGFNKLKNITFNNALGFGSAWGYEFLPIINKIKKLTIVEPSDNMVNSKIEDLFPIYIKPSIDGSLPFEDDSFDLITCFGTLHHIPNVSFVIKELIRVLNSDGHLLIREPIISMGDWRIARKGLTKNERGIPISIFESELAKYPVTNLSTSFCFTATNIIQQKAGIFFKRPIYSYRFYVLFDKFISRILKKNVRYHAIRKRNKIAPQSIFYIIKKNRFSSK